MVQSRALRTAIPGVGGRPGSIILPRLSWASHLNISNPFPHLKNGNNKLLYLIKCVEGMKGDNVSVSLPRAWYLKGHNR